MNNNYYFDHIVEILKEGGDWLEKVNRFDEKNGVPVDCDEERSEFLMFVRNKKFHKDGSFEYIWKDGTLHCQPEE